MDVHEWEDHDIFTKCAHDELTLFHIKTKPWLKESSFAYAALQTIVTDKSLISNLKHLTNFNHTGTLEVYHSLYNKYSPKRLHFLYPGIIARSQLAVLDFNSGVGLAQSKNRQRNLRFKHQFSKVTQSWVVKKIPKKRTEYLPKSYLE